MRGEASSVATNIMLSLWLTLPSVTPRGMLQAPVTLLPRFVPGLPQLVSFSRFRCSCCDKVGAVDALLHWK